MSNTDEPGSPYDQDGSGQQDDASKAAAPKDRQCPFCQTPFTSSSLGRHLDLYIKDKNPKPPDGIHDVDKIRQMRGKITRRHPKGSSAAARSAAMARNMGHSPVSAQAPGLTESNLRSDAPFDDAFISQTARANSMNRLNWQATGVINDLPAKDDRSYGATLPLPENSAASKAGEPGDGASSAEVALRDLIKKSPESGGSNTKARSVRLRRVQS